MSDAKDKAIALLNESPRAAFRMFVQDETMVSLDGMFTKEELKALLVLMNDVPELHEGREMIYTSQGKAVYFAGGEMITRDILAIADGYYIIEPKT